MQLPVIRKIHLLRIETKCRCNFFFAEKFLMEDMWMCESHRHFQVSGRTKKQYSLCMVSMVQHVISICDIWKTVIDFSFFFHSLPFVFSIFSAYIMFNLSCFRMAKEGYVMPTKYIWYSYSFPILALLNFLIQCCLNFQIFFYVPFVVRSMVGTQKMFLFSFFFTHVKLICRDDLM